MSIEERVKQHSGRGDREEAVRLLKETNMVYRDIAEKTGVPRGTVGTLALVYRPKEVRAENTELSQQKQPVIARGVVAVKEEPVEAEQVKAEDAQSQPAIFRRMNLDVLVKATRFITKEEAEKEIKDIHTLVKESFHESFTFRMHVKSESSVTTEEVEPQALNSNSREDKAIQMLKHTKLTYRQIADLTAIDYSKIAAFGVIYRPAHVRKGNVMRGVNVPSVQEELAKLNQELKKQAGEEKNVVRSSTESMLTYTQSKQGVAVTKDEFMQELVLIQKAIERAEKGSGFLISLDVKGK